MTREGQDAEGVRPRILVIGWGNPSRSDDGAAYGVAARLRERLGGAHSNPDPPLLAPPARPEPYGTTAAGLDVDVLLLHQLGPEVAALLEGYAWVVFVDAHVENGSAGSWAQPVPEADLTLPVSHTMAPGVVMAIARALYGHTPRAYLLSVGGHNFNFGATLSASTRERAAEAAEWILCLGDATRAGTAVPRSLEAEL